MALAIDASSPPSVVGAAAAGPINSASFNPPANSLITVIAGADNASTVTIVVTDNQAHTYTRHARSNSSGGDIEVYSYYTSVALSGVSVRATYTGAWTSSNSGLLTVLVFTGASSTQPGSVVTNASATIALTPNALNSYIVGGTIDIANSKTATGTADTTILQGINGGVDAFTLASWRSTAVTSALTSTTYGLSNAGFTNPNSAAVEILANAVPAITPTVAWFVA